MAHRVCPWWLGYFLASPLRAWYDSPPGVIAAYVAAGMTVLEPGPGMGYFTLEIARRVGEAGRVIAVDIQPKMLERLKRRAAKAGLGGRINPRLAGAESMGIDDLTGQVDFVLAYAVVHELPSDAVFFAEASRALKPGGTLLLAEPSGHVTAGAFDEELANAARVNLEVVTRPALRRNRMALLRKV
jgi:ubiquinone/menaquinone biosynthesis C-methylase UbiE